MNAQTVLRIARPTDQLEEVVRFYTDGVGLIVLSSFENHEGFDGVIVGGPNTAYHLEFTRKRGHHVASAPTHDHLLVFYLPSRQEWTDAIDRMTVAGYKPVPSFNPYWDCAGVTYEDPEGYRVVLQNDEWSIPSAGNVHLTKP